VPVDSVRALDQESNTGFARRVEYPRDLRQSAAASLTEQNATGILKGRASDAGAFCEGSQSQRKAMRPRVREQELSAQLLAASLARTLSRGDEFLRSDHGLGGCRFHAFDIISRCRSRNLTTELFAGNFRGLVDTVLQLRGTGA
jgi:hypothetical protein